MAQQKLSSINCNVDEGKGRTNVNGLIPKYRRGIRIKAGGEDGGSYLFWYKDSAAFYVSTLRTVGKNYDNIRNQNGSYGKQFTSDSIAL